MWTCCSILAFSCVLWFVSGSCLDPSCKFVFDPEEPSTAVFDLTPVCLEAQNADFTHNDVLGFAYFAQVCGGIDVHQHCNPPDWTPEHHRGTAMQLWGSVFQCPGGDCDANCSTVANCTGDDCCTPKCEVLAIGKPVWSLADPTNVHTGGLVATFSPLQRVSNGSLQCLHGSQTVQYHFHCDWDLGASRLGAVTVSGNGPDACLFRFDFYSKHACIQPVVSPGWVILGCVLMLWGAYVTLGMAWMMLKHGRFDYAHRDAWRVWLADVKLGAAVLLAQLPCCQRKYEHVQ